MRVLYYYTMSFLSKFLMFITKNYYFRLTYAILSIFLFVFCSAFLAGMSQRRRRLVKFVLLLFNKVLNLIEEKVLKFAAK